MIRFLDRLAALLLIWVIKVYQTTLSFDHGPLRHLFPYGYCRFHPTCSNYALLALERFGLVSGSWLAIKRLVRCHPWNQGGNDPVPTHL